MTMYKCPAKDQDGKRRHGHSPRLVWLRWAPGIANSGVRPWCRECLGEANITDSHSRQELCKQIAEFYHLPESAIGYLSQDLVNMQRADSAAQPKAQA